MNAKSAKGGAERRCYILLLIKLDALVAIDGRSRILRSVRDFCVAGMFVAISAQQLRLVKPKMSAILYLALVVHGKKQDHQLAFSIFRVIGGGFGCRFENVDTKTISLLQSLANSLNPKQDDQASELLSETQSKFSPWLLEVKRPLAGLAEEVGCRICEDFL